MATSAQSESEWNQAALAMLRRLGVSNPQVGEDGAFAVAPGTFEVIEINRSEATPPPLRLFNAAPTPAETAQAVVPYANPLCVLLPCGPLRALGIDCCSERTTYNDPRIIADSIPVRIPSATANLNPFDASIEGDIRTRFRNQSEPGEECVEVECRCQAGGGKDCRTVDGSATVDGQDTDKVVSTAIDEVVDTVSNAFGGVVPEQSTDSEATFQKQGALELIEALLDILISGTMRVRANVTTTVRYTWRGRTQSKRFDTNATVRLPVDNVTYSW